eukprot:TRINITY_DN10442_c0_g1_i1.p1 TRINITY_DN10442_c0_g1~~TRINITY_DN10442_c0_g1_i1.p1  ORF type:complete len:585 (+),score=238.10 TRINITY_DN10442_c0_g1_i1:125-1879(+)
MCIRDSNDGNVSWSEFKAHGLVVERFPGDVGLLLGDARSSGWQGQMSPMAFEQFVVGGLERVFQVLDSDRSLQLEANEQQIVWELFGVGSAYQPKPSMSCTQFVDWIVETANALGWPRFREGFLKMLQHAVQTGVGTHGLHSPAARTKLHSLEEQAAQPRELQLQREQELQQLQTQTQLQKAEHAAVIESLNKNSQESSQRTSSEVQALRSANQRLEKELENSTRQALLDNQTLQAMQHKHQSTQDELHKEQLARKELQRQCDDAEHTASRSKQLQDELDDCRRKLHEADSERRRLHAEADDSLRKANHGEHRCESQEQQLEELRSKVRARESEMAELKKQLSKHEAAREAAVADNTIDKQHISEAIKGMQQHLDEQLTRMRVEGGDIELQRRHSMTSTELQNTKVSNQLLLKEIAELRTASRLAGLERDSFKSEAEHHSRELAKSKQEREQLLETIARQQNELTRQHEKLDDAMLEASSQRELTEQRHRFGEPTSWNLPAAPRGPQPRPEHTPDILGISPQDMHRAAAPQPQQHTSEWARAAADASITGDAAAIVALSEEMAAKAHRIQSLSLIHISEPTRPY